MAVTVAAVGLIIVLIGLIGILTPSGLLGFAQRVAGSTAGFVMSILVRAALGIVFLLAASSTRLPTVISAIGILSLLAAVGLALIGPARMQRFMHRWTTWPIWFVRLSLLFAISFGALLTYAAS